MHAYQTPFILPPPPLSLSLSLPPAIPLVVAAAYERVGRREGGEFRNAARDRQSCLRRWGPQISPIGQPGGRKGCRTGRLSQFVGSVPCLPARTFRQAFLRVCRASSSSYRNMAAAPPTLCSSGLTRDVGHALLGAWDPRLRVCRNRYYRYREPTCSQRGLYLALIHAFGQPGKHVVKSVPLGGGRLRSGHSEVLLLPLDATALACTRLPLPKIISRNNNASLVL